MSAGGSNGCTRLVPHSARRLWSGPWSIARAVSGAREWIREAGGMSRVGVGLRWSVADRGWSVRVRATATAVSRPACVRLRATADGYTPPTSGGYSCRPNPDAPRTESMANSPRGNTGGCGGHPFGPAWWGGKQPSTPWGRSRAWVDRLSVLRRLQRFVDPGVTSSRRLD